MKYFNLLRSDIDLGPFLAEIALQEALWLKDTSRQDKIFAQRDTNTIFLSSPKRRPDIQVNENQESHLTAASLLFPHTTHFLSAFAASREASLSRATIVRLKPHSTVSRHTDAGSYYLIRDRYHLVLQSPNGSHLRSGGEEVLMRDGELWWFDNKQHHEAHNYSDEWRIHCIFDLLPDLYKHLAINPVPVEKL